MSDTEHQIPSNNLMQVVANQAMQAIQDWRRERTHDNAQVMAEVASHLAELVSAVAQPIQAEADEIIDLDALPEGIHSGNVDEFVPAPSTEVWSYVDGFEDNTRVSFAGNKFGEGIEVVLSFGDPAEPRSMRLRVNIPTENLPGLLEQVIMPQLHRRAEITRVSEALHARELEAAEREQQEMQRWVETCAFRLQKTYGSPDRLHRHTCYALDNARGESEPLSLEQLVTKELPSIRNKYETLLTPHAITMNRRARDSRHGQKNGVLTLCGRCKPIGDRSKDVSDSLHHYAHLTVEQADAMERVVRLLVEIEEGATQVDAQYQQQRAEQ